MLAINFLSANHNCSRSAMAAILDLQSEQFQPFFFFLICKSPRYFLPSFLVNWPFGSGEKAQRRHSKWPLCQPSWISDRIGFSYFFICKLPWYFLPSFKAFGRLVQKKKLKMDFQDGHYAGHLRFSIRMVLAIFDLQVTLILPTKVLVSWPFGSGEEAKNSFSICQHSGYLGFSIGTILAIFDRQVTLILPTKYRVNWPFGEGVQNKFSTWPLWRPSWISNR